MSNIVTVSAEADCRTENWPRLILASKGFLRLCLNRMLLVVVKVLGAILPMQVFVGYTVRPFFHRLRGVKINGRVWIGNDVYLEEIYPERLELHDGVVIATRCTIISHAKGPGRIVIEKNAALGAGCVVVCASGKTLRIGEGAVISAGSTVSHGIPRYTLCGPPRIKAYGKVTVPIAMASTYEEFRRGLRPIKGNDRHTDSSGE